MLYIKILNISDRLDLTDRKMSRGCKSKQSHIFNFCDCVQCDQIWLFPARLAIFEGLLAGKICCWRETAKLQKLAIFEFGPNSLIFM